jgi:hypothetical protein
VRDEGRGAFGNALLPSPFSLLPSPFSTVPVRFLLFLAMISTRALAQTPGWSGTAQASANVLFGSASSRVLAGLVGAGKADSVIDVRGDVRTTYSDARPVDAPRRVTSRASRATVAIDYRPFATVSPFIFGSAENSLQQRIDYRMSTGVGAKLTLRRVGDDDTSLSLAVLWERTRVRNAEPGTSAASERGRWSLRFRDKHKLGGGFTLSHVTFWQPALDSFEQYVIDSNTTLAANVLSRLALTASFQDRYDSEGHARGARSNNEGQVLFGLQATF